MTRRLEAQLQSVQQRTRQSAEVACSMADAMRRGGLTPMQLDGIQTGLRKDLWSAIVPPVLLWPISSEARAALLMGDVFFTAVIRPDVWTDSMAAVGLALHENGNGTWRIVGQAGDVNLDAVEVQKLTLGVAFMGISPRDIARRLADSLAEQDEDS